jgi:two-component system, cell cycle response regulator
MVPDASGATSTLYAELKAAKRLPSPPGAALRVLELCRQDDADIQEISRVIASDPVLAGRLLKFANSPMAGIAREVTSIRDALLLLGLRTVKLTALGFSIAAPGQASRCAGFDLKAFWAAGCLRAVIARWLAPRFHGVDREEAFTVALVAGLGQLALAQGLGERYAQVLAEARKGLPLHQVERQMLGSDQVQICARLLQEWGLPVVLVQAVAAQSPEFPSEQTDHPTNDLSQVLRLSNELLPSFLTSRGGAVQLTEAAAHLVWSVLGCDAAAWARISSEILDDYRSMAALLDVELDDPASVVDLYAAAQEEATRVGMVAQFERTKAVQDQESLLRRATTDPQTGVANRARFDERLALELAGVRRAHGHFALLIFAIDHFKTFNDTHGHQVGDLVLKRVATAISNALREVDLLARYGGEEFAVLAAHTDRKGACVVAARIQQCVEELWLDVNGVRLNVRISSGLAVTADFPQVPNAEQLIAEADKQFHVSKDAGRNTWSYKGRSASKNADASARSPVVTVA